MTSRLYDDADARLERLEALVDREFHHRDQMVCMWRARYYLLRAFTQPQYRRPSRLRLRGLAREIDGRFLMASHYARREAKRLAWWSEAARAVTPIGWRWEIVCDRDAIRIMPAWLYYPRRWWWRARSWWWWRRYEARR